MALRNQPYLPLYVQDFLTDEKLNECSAESTGVYIRLMCVMHKSDKYGTILLKQKDKQNSSKIENFALKISKQMPYSLNVILNSLTELIDENVIQIEGDYLIQKRMTKDNDISEKRSKSGKAGGEKTQFAKAKDKAKDEAKDEANSENEFEFSLLNITYCIENSENLTPEIIKQRQQKIWKEAFSSDYWIENNAMSLKTEILEVKKLLKEFLLMIFAKDESYKSFSDLKSYFANWSKKQLEKQL